jgi:DNA (cytosine-5)-methyltransferase 1
MPTAVDIFAGAGGISLGLRNAGWDVVAACDNDPMACATYAANHLGTHLIQGEIQSPQTLTALVQATRVLIVARN